MTEHGKRQQTESRLAGMEGTGEPGAEGMGLSKTASCGVPHHPCNTPLCWGSRTPGKVLPSEARPRRTPPAPDGVGALSGRKEAAPLLMYSPEKASKACPTEPHVSPQARPDSREGTSPLSPRKAGEVEGATQFPSLSAGLAAGQARGEGPQSQGRELGRAGSPASATVCCRAGRKAVPRSMF